MSVLKERLMHGKEAVGRYGSTAVRAKGGKTVGSIVIVLFLTALPTHHLPAQSTSLTIYNDGRVLVRRTVGAEVSKGNSTQRIALGALDISTLFSLDSSVVITASSYDGAVDENSVLRRAIGRRLKFRHAGPPVDSLGAQLVGVDPERWRMPEGNIQFGRPGTPLYPDDIVVLDPVVNLSLRTTNARKELRLGYFTGGAQWQASYQIVLGASQAQVTGSAVINSQTLRAENTEIQLLAGSVSRAVMDDERRREFDMVARKAAAEGVAVAEQRVGEFHLYSLPGRSTLLPGVATSIALFDPGYAKYERSYVVKGHIPYWGGLPQYGEETEIPVEISYLVKRPRKTEFGDRPLPGGVARLFQADSTGRLQLVGEARLGHTPAGEDLRLAAGTAFDLTAKRVQTTYITRRDSVRAGYWRTVATADYAVTLNNAGDSAVTIEVHEERGGEWSVLSSSVPPEKVSSTLTRFRVAVPGRGETVLKYRVRVIW